MKIAIIGAGFTPGEADGLRRAMATFRRNGEIHHYEAKFIAGMVANGYARDFAERCFEQIKGFSDYGFPLSHAASFALLVYVSAWIKRFHPDVFAAALLNSQPMGFYAPAQIVRDACDHGVEIRPVDVNHSDWDCTLEASPAGEKPVIASAAKQSPAREAPLSAGDCHGTLRDNPPGRFAAVPLGSAREASGRVVRNDTEVHAGGRHALRLGFRQVKGLAEAAGRVIATRRGAGYGSVAELQHRAGLDRRALESLAAADAFRSLDLDRRQALWAVKGLREISTAPSPHPSPARGEGVQRARGENPSPLWGEGATRLGASRPAPEGSIAQRSNGLPHAKHGRARGEAGENLLAPLAGTDAEPPADLPVMGLGEHVVEDYRTLGLSLKRHPLALLRGELDRRRILPNARLAATPAETRVRVAGLVLVRQQPGTASGVIFMTLEDETGIANLVVWRAVSERFRRVVMGARLVACMGRVQREGEVIHVVAERLADLSPLLRRLGDPAATERPELAVRSRDFR